MSATPQLGYQGEVSSLGYFADSPRLNYYDGSFGNFRHCSLALHPSPDQALDPHSSWCVGMTVESGRDHPDCSADWRAL